MKIDQLFIADIKSIVTTAQGKAFTLANLKNFCQFYLVFSDASKSYTVCSLLTDNVPPSIRRELAWSHYRLIMRVENPKAREYYIKEAADNNLPPSTGLIFQQKRS